MPAAPNPQPTPRRRRRGLIALLVVGFLVLGLAVAAVVAVQQGWLPFAADSTPEAPEAVDPAPSPPVEPAPSAGFDPEAPIEHNLAAFTAALDGFAAGGDPVAGVPIVDAIVAAGFDRTSMQVSFDRTETDLPADNIFVSVRLGSECLIGQVVAETRAVIAVVEPAVGPDGGLCLIGQTRPIDW